MNNTHLVVLESRDYVPPFHGVAMNNTHLVVLEGRDYEPPISRRCNEQYPCLLISRTDPPAATLVLLNQLHGYADGTSLTAICALQYRAVQKILQIKHSALTPHRHHRLRKFHWVHWLHWHRTGSRG